MNSKLTHIICASISSTPLRFDNRKRSHAMVLIVNREKTKYIDKEPVAYMDPIDDGGCLRASSQCVLELALLGDTIVNISSSNDIFWRF